MLDKKKPLYVCIVRRNLNENSIVGSLKYKCNEGTNISDLRGSVYRPRQVTDQRVAVAQRCAQPWPHRVSHPSGFSEPSRSSIVTGLLPRLKAQR